MFNKPYFALALFAVLLFPTACSDSAKTAEGVKTVHFPGTDIVEQSIPYVKGKKNGHAKEYYRDGILKKDFFFVNDSLDDTSFTYYPNGKLRALQVYKNKLKDGCWKEYNSEGKLISEIFLKNDRLDGTSSTYTYKSGRLLTRITYKDGVKNGSEEHFYNNGKPKSKCFYDMGNACMGTEEWYDNGKKLINDFKISVSERNDVLLNNTLSYVIHLEGAKATDKVYRLLSPCEGNKIGAHFPLKKTAGAFILEFNIAKGQFVIDHITLAAYRQTPFGNTFIKTTSFNVSVNHF